MQCNGGRFAWACQTSVAKSKLFSRKHVRKSILKRVQRGPSCIDCKLTNVSAAVEEEVVFVVIGHIQTLRGYYRSYEIEFGVPDRARKYIGNGSTGSLESIDDAVTRRKLLATGPELILIYVACGLGVSLRVASPVKHYIGGY